MINTKFFNTQRTECIKILDNMLAYLEDVDQALDYAYDACACVENIIAELHRIEGEERVKE